MSLELIDHRYRQRSVLGEGAMGKVWLMEDTLTGQMVALKAIAHRAAGSTDKSVLQFQQEFRVMTQLSHPNCCMVHSYGQLEDGAPYFTMEVVPGQGLDELIPLSEERFRTIFPQLLLALGYIHQLGYVHRDLKPANVRVRPDGVVKLMDYGLMDQAGRASAAVAGTLPYVSPEMVKRAPVDQRSDLYSLGCLGYELLTGKVPFDKPTPLEVLRGHAEQLPDSMRELRPELTAAIDEVILRLLAKDPLERFQSAEDVLEAMGVAAPARIGGNLLSAPLVHRDGELKGLKVRLDALKRAEPGEIMLVHGPEGVGKTHLLEEFRFMAELAGLPVVMGKAYESGNFPYRHFVWVLKSLVPSMRARTPEVLARLAPVLVKLLPELGVPAAPEMEPGQEKLRLQAAVTEAMRALASVQPFVVILENWQWAEPLSVELLGHLRRNLAGTPVLLLIASRLEHAEPTDPLADLARLHVTCLQPSGTRRMVQAMLGTRELDLEFADQVNDLTGGNPLHIERLLEHLVTQGSLTRVRGKWQTDGVLTAAALPPDLRGLLSENLEGLSDAAVRVASAGAVVGPSFELETCREVAGLSDEVLFDALAELTRRLILVPGEVGSYGFAQATYQTYFYGLIGPEARATGHQAAYAALVRLHGEQAGERALEVVAAMARHALIAGLTEPAITLCLEAGTRNALLYANADAEELLGAGLRQIQAAGPERWRKEKLRYLHTIGDVRRVVSNLENAKTAYDEAARLAEDFGETATLGRILTSLGKVLQMSSQYPEALEACERALAACQASGALAEGARCLLTSARIRYFQGHLPAAVADAERGLAMAREAQDMIQLGTALGFWGYLVLAQGPERAEDGLKALQEAVGILETLGDRIGLHTALDYLANSQMNRGDFMEARETFVNKQAICMEIGLKSDAPYGLVNLATIALEQGDYEEARRQAREAAVVAGTAKLPLAFARMLEAGASFHLGRMREGDRLAAEALELAEGLGNQYLIGLMLPHLADFELFMGRLEEAERHLMALAGLAKESDARLKLALLEGRLLRLRGQFPSAAGRLQSVQEEFEATQAKGLKVAMWLERCRVHVAREAWDAGLADAELGQALAERIGARAQEAELWGVIGEIRLATGQAAIGAFDTMAGLAGGTGSKLMAALAAFGQAASNAYSSEAGAHVQFARADLESFTNELDEAGRQRFLAQPDRHRAWEGNHIAFSLARVRKRGTGQLHIGGHTGPLGLENDTGPLKIPGMWNPMGP
jgi:predicted ATPase